MQTLFLYGTLHIAQMMVGELQSTPSFPSHLSLSSFPPLLYFTLPSLPSLPPPPTLPPHLEVVGQLLPSSVARVHGNEDGTRGIKGDFRSLKDKPLEPLVHSHLDAEDLLGNH